MLPGAPPRAWAKVGAFVDGSANFLMAIGLSTGVAVALMGVLVASFAGTTLDTACRLQRYAIQEIGRTPESSKRRVVGLSQKQARSDHFRGSSCRSNGCGPPSGEAWAIENAGKGGLLLWPLFGATNQLLAGLSFLGDYFLSLAEGQAGLVSRPAHDLHAHHSGLGDVSPAFYESGLAGRGNPRLPAGRDRIGHHRFGNMDVGRGLPAFPQGQGGA